MGVLVLTTLKWWPAKQVATKAVSTMSMFFKVFLMICAIYHSSTIRYFAFFVVIVILVVLRLPYVLVYYYFVGQSKIMLNGIL